MSRSGPLIVLAPLAGGPSTPELAAAVSNAGGLGFVAAGYLSAGAFREQLQRTRALTDAAFGANLFLLRDEPVDDAAVAAYARELERYGLPLGEPRFDNDALAGKLDVVIAEQVPIVSTTFGCPSPAIVARLHDAGSEVWVTVTSRDEAVAATDAGADVLVVQGSEAGGHHGAWSNSDAPTSHLLPLLAEVTQAVDLPLVAAGGIATRAHVEAALSAGARAAQAGSAFLLCPEAGTNEPHRRALAHGGETAVTRAFTGRPARGIVNAFMRAHPDAPHAYPQVNNLTAPLRAAARAAGDAELINLWAGVNFAATEALPAAEIVARLRP